MVSTVAGFVFTMIALVANGSFAVFVKVPRVASIGTDSATFMLFMSVGIVITSLLSILLYPVLPESPPHVIITGWGILAGAIFVCSVTFSFLGIDYVGLAVAQGTWGACALLVSYLWGVLLFGNAMDSVFLSVVAVFLLLAGGAGIALCEVIASRLCGRSKGGDLEQQDHLLPGNPTSDPESGPTSSHSLGVEKFDRPRRSSSVFLSTDGGGPTMQNKNSVMGLVCSIGVGVFGGSILAPQHYAPAVVAGIGFLPSFAIGVAIAAPVVVLVTALYNGHLPRFKSRADFWIALTAGAACGAVWNIGNASAIYGIQGLGYSVAYSLVQCAVVVSGLWGITVFKEISGWSIVVFAAATAVLLVGAVVLAING